MACGPGQSDRSSNAPQSAGRIDGGVFHVIGRGDPMHLVREILLAASQSRSLRERLMRRRFMRRAVARFMPGERLEDALEAARALRPRGIASVLTYLGENVDSPAEADRVTAHYLDVLDRARATGLDAHISVKLTQLGLDLSPDRAAANLKTIVEHAAGLANFIWVDMESSRYVDPTLEIYRHLRLGHPNLGICLQAYLYRTRRDLAELLPLRPAIRLVKGAYNEPEAVAYSSKRKVDAAYLKRAATLLGEAARTEGARPAFATHDLRLIDRIRERAEDSGVPRDAYEIQMLYGIRRREQLALAERGHRVRVLISYGTAWYPWFVRRLAERPANLLFVLRHALVG